MRLLNQRKKEQGLGQGSHPIQWLLQSSNFPRQVNPLTATLWAQQNLEKSQVYENHPYNPLVFYCAS